MPDPLDFSHLELGGIPALSDDVGLYYLESEKTAPELRQYLAGLLDSTEQARRDRFHSASAQALFELSHGLTRVALSRWHAVEYGSRIDPSAWRFSADHLGKPAAFLPENNSDAPTAPQFSLSHTPGAALVAVAARGKIGVDLESANRLADALPLANRYFAPEECADVLAQADEAAKRRRFLFYWTLKEAYLKALGLGITRPLASFAFYSDAGEARLLYDHNGVEGEWRFPTLALPGGMMGAVARKTH